ncbi:MAG TPA: type II toxin-antitoxin system RelE/ParE family toxin [Thermoanaerobaculia bacterium]|nr:type II toxin-antitoxin system RelE/ParE family toxin [Thermoanaerobaculia bacterium]
MRIEWTDPAIADLEAIRDYIARDSEYYGAQFVGRIIDAVEKLPRFPEMGRRVPEARSEIDVRELIFQNYRIIYRLKADKIQIITVLHGSRNLRGMKPKPWEVV